jgi:hypothetical protein
MSTMADVFLSHRSAESATPAVLQKLRVITATIRNQKKHHIQPIGTSVNLILVGQNAAM